MRRVEDLDYRSYLGRPGHAFADRTADRAIGNVMKRKRPRIYDRQSLPRTSETPIVIFSTYNTGNQRDPVTPRDALTSTVSKLHIKLAELSIQRKSGQITKQEYRVQKTALATELRQTEAVRKNQQLLDSF